MTTYYVILKTNQTGGAPTVEDTLYDGDIDAEEDAFVMTREARNDGRRDLFEVYELTHHYSPQDDLDAEAAAQAGKP